MPFNIGSTFARSSSAVNGSRRIGTSGGSCASISGGLSIVGVEDCMAVATQSMDDEGNDRGVLIGDEDMPTLETGRTRTAHVWTLGPGETFGSGRHGRHFDAS